MVAAASWVLLTGVHHHCVNVFVLPTAELASECSRDVAVIRFVVATVRVACARIQKESPQARVLLPAMDAVERSASVPLKKRMLALVRAARMMVAGVSEKRRRIPIFLSAIFTVLAHVTPSQISTSQLPNFRPPTRRLILSFCNMDYSITFTPYSGKCLSAVTTVKPLKSAGAMMKRSAGSLWCSGSKDALNMIVVSRGAMSSA